MEAEGQASLQALAESVLRYRNPEYRLGLCCKLCDEGIIAPEDLRSSSERAMETKLACHAAFNLQELGDSMRLRRAANRTAQGSTGRGGERDGGRSRSRNGGRARSGGPRQGAARGRRGGLHDSRACHPGDRGFSPSVQPKPALWRTVEEGSLKNVCVLLQGGADVEEKFRGWSPLMKAAEEGHTEIIRELLKQRANLEVTNKKGRGPLSFAAAPSMKRPANPVALWLLLEAGADRTRTDDGGNTAKERAMIEKRHDAVAVFEEFERAGRRHD